MTCNKNGAHSCRYNTPDVLEEARSLTRDPYTHIGGNGVEGRAVR